MMRTPLPSSLSHRSDIGDVKAAGRNVSGDENRRRAVLERCQYRVPLLLPLIPVDGRRAELAADRVGQLVAHALCPAEDDDARPRGLRSKDADELLVLL